MNREIIVTPYQSDWPMIFEIEAGKIREVLGDNCLMVHHVGSTAVPGLTAKPKIDMLLVIRDASLIVEILSKIGFRYRGEFNIPMHHSFDKREEVAVNLHVYEEGHPEIELNLLFRDYLRDHSEARDEYAQLKKSLLEDSASHLKNHSILTGYNLGKDVFIRKILKAAHFNRIRIVRCAHYAEWKMAKIFRQKYFFDPAGITDPYTWTFDHKDHIHLILSQGVEIAGYAHIQIWPEHRAALRIFVIEEAYRNRGFGSEFLQFCETWLKKQGIQSIHDEARPEAVEFYRKNGYIEMPFEDPTGEQPSFQDIAMGKRL